MRFQPTKCNMMQLTRKRVKKVIATYKLEGTVLENVDRIKYLGVTITNDLKWNIHVGNIWTKANRTLGFLRRNISSCPRDVKEMAYKGLVRPILEYASPVWDPSGKTLQDELEKVQNRAARFVTGNYNFETGSILRSFSIGIPNWSHHSHICHFLILSGDMMRGYASRSQDFLFAFVQTLPTWVFRFKSFALLHQDTWFCLHFPRLFP